MSGWRYEWLALWVLGTRIKLKTSNLINSLKNKKSEIYTEVGNKK